MILTFHIGKCCGVKTVYGFPYGDDGPNRELPSLEALEEQNNADANGRHVSSTDRFFHDEAPSETGVERLDRYIQYMKERRPQNLLEVCLIDKPVSGSNYWTQEAWFPILKERGFRRVSRFKNSNSGNVVNVFHLTINNGPEQSQEDVDADDGWLDDE